MEIAVDGLDAGLTDDLDIGSGEDSLDQVADMVATRSALRMMIRTDDAVADKIEGGLARRVAPTDHRHVLIRIVGGLDPGGSVIDPGPGEPLRPFGGKHPIGDPRRDQDGLAVGGGPVAEPDNTKRIDAAPGQSPRPESASRL